MASFPKFNKNLKQKTGDLKGQAIVVKRITTTPIIIIILRTFRHESRWLKWFCHPLRDLHHCILNIIANKYLISLKMFIFIILKSTRQKNIIRIVVEKI